MLSIDENKNKGQVFFEIFNDYFDNIPIEYTTITPKNTLLFRIERPETSDDKNKFFSYWKKEEITETFDNPWITTLRENLYGKTYKIYGITKNLNLLNLPYPSLYGEEIKPYYLKLYIKLILMAEKIYDREDVICIYENLLENIFDNDSDEILEQVEPIYKKAFLILESRYSSLECDKNLERKYFLETYGWGNLKGDGSNNIIDFFIRRYSL